MSYVLDDSQKKKLKKELKKMKELKNEDFNFDEVNHDEIIKLLEKSPLVSTLPAPDKDNLKYLPEKQGNNYVLVEKDEVIKIPEIYNSTIEFATLHGFRVFDENNFQFKEAILELIKKLLELLNRGKNNYDRIVEIIDNADKIYQDLREDIKMLEDEHDNRLIEILILVPDLFVYLMRLLACDEVDKGKKLIIIRIIIYFVIPIDLIPEAFLNAIGYIDDVYITIHYLINFTNEKYLSRDIEIELWPGRIETLDNLNKYYKDLEELLGIDLIKKLIEKFKEKSSEPGFEAS